MESGALLRENRMSELPRKAVIMSRSKIATIVRLFHVTCLYQCCILIVQIIRTIQISCLSEFRHLPLLVYYSNRSNNLNDSNFPLKVADVAALMQHFG